MALAIMVQSKLPDAKGISSGDAVSVGTTDAAGRYVVSSVPGLTFFPDKIWLAKDDWDYPLEETWFEVARVKEWFSNF